MAVSLRVDSDVVIATADVMGELGAATAATRIGQSLSGAAGALPGMATAHALRASGDRVDGSCRAIGREFDALSANLMAAVHEYGETDGLSGDAISKVANKMAL